MSLMKNVDFTWHLTCKVTAYLTRVHVVHKCKERQANTYEHKQKVSKFFE